MPAERSDREGSPLDALGPAVDVTEGDDFDTRDAFYGGTGTVDATEGDGFDTRDAFYDGRGSALGPPSTSPRATTSTPATRSTTARGARSAHRRRHRGRRLRHPRRVLRRHGERARPTVDATEGDDFDTRDAFYDGTGSALGPPSTPPRATASTPATRSTTARGARTARRRRHRGRRLRHPRRVLRRDAERAPHNDGARTWRQPATPWRDRSGRTIAVQWRAAESRVESRAS